MLENMEIPDILEPLQQSTATEEKQKVQDTHSKRASVLIKQTKLNIPYYRKVMKVPLTKLKNEFNSMQLH